MTPGAGGGESAGTVLACAAAGVLPAGVLPAGAAGVPGAEDPPCTKAMALSLPAWLELGVVVAGWVCSTGAGLGSAGGGALTQDTSKPTLATAINRNRLIDYLPIISDHEYSAPGALKPAGLYFSTLLT